MENICSRRKLIASLSMLSLSSIARGSEKAISSSSASMGLKSVLSSTTRKQAVDVVLDYFAKTAPQLLRSKEGILRYPSIAPSLPGKAYSTSLWDWDTLWTARGLFRFARLTSDNALRQRIAEHAKGSLFNFLENQSPEGRVSIMLNAKQTDPFGCLKMASPNSRNQAKPVFGQLALLVADETGSADWFAPFFDRLLRFYDSWMLGNQSSIGLFVWGDDVAIGNDNDPTTFGRPFFSSANLLLNCLFYEDLKAAAEIANRISRHQDAYRLQQQFQLLGENIQKFCWDSRDQFYYTVDVQCVDRRAELIHDVKQGMDMSWSCLPMRIQTFTGFLPLWCKLATPEQAKELVASNYLEDRRFRGDFGVRSLSSRESMYSMEFSSNPSNWLGPVWIIVNYFVWKGLKNFGFDEVAGDLADKTLLLLSSDIQKNGCLNEYYHPDTGASLSHKGFMDWNLLSLEMI